VKNFSERGFKTQSQPLTHFQSDYGLKGDPEDEADDNDEGGEAGGSDDGSGSDESEN